MSKYTVYTRGIMRGSKREEVEAFDFDHELVARAFAKNNLWKHREVHILRRDGEAACVIYYAQGPWFNATP